MSRQLSFSVTRMIRYIGTSEVNILHGDGVIARAWPVCSYSLKILICPTSSPHSNQISGQSDDYCSIRSLLFGALNFSGYYKCDLLKIFNCVQELCRFFNLWGSVAGYLGELVGQIKFF